VVLTSADHPGDTSRARTLGIAAYLTKPIHQSELFDALVSIAAGARPLAQSGPGVTLVESGDRGKAVAALPGDASTAAGVGSTGLAAGSDRAHTLRILVAEDNPVNQVLARRILERRGHEVKLAGTGREALDLATREPFDVVLMDVQMPEMDGFEAARAIRAAEASSVQHLPIVAMTAHAMKGDRERCIEAGMDNYIAKPIQASALLQAIAEVTLERNQEPL
jgi:CheY-like chemotaxis protein